MNIELGVASFEDSDTLPLTSSQQHPIVCTRTGLLVAALTVHKVAGHVPYLSQWKDTQAFHPLFSVPPTSLLKFSRRVWMQLCSLTPEQAADPKVTDRHELLLRVAALAMLHNISDVHQSTVWLPTLAEVSSNWNSLLQLSSWKAYLDSTRFKFPELRISKFNKGIDLTAYIQDCWQIKKEYETVVREGVEKEKLAAAEAALKAIRDDIAGKAPRSKKLLWRWFIANIPARYARDTDGWMWELFDAETYDEVSEFTLSDIDLFEEIVLAELPTGSSISHAFLDRLAVKRQLLDSTVRSFEIILPPAIQKEKDSLKEIPPEPKRSDYDKSFKFIMAHAKWKLLTTDFAARYAKEQAQQAKVTVKPSYVPNISEYLGRDAASDEGDSDDELPLIDRSDDTITGEYEE
jgi:hypothetical protein